MSTLILTAIVSSRATIVSDPAAALNRALRLGLTPEVVPSDVSSAVLQGDLPEASPHQNVLPVTWQACLPGSHDAAIALNARAADVERYVLLVAHGGEHVQDTMMRSQSRNAPRQPALGCTASAGEREAPFAVYTCEQVPAVTGAAPRACA